MTAAPDPVWAADGVLLDVLVDLGVEFERVQAGAYLVTLRASRTTLVWLIAGEQAVAVEAFVMHVVPDACPDASALHRWILRRNLTLRDVHFALDDVGDVFLAGSLATVSVEAVDRVLGEVLALLDAAPIETLAYGSLLSTDEALAAKVRADGAGRRPAGTPQWAPRRDARR